MKTNNPSKSSNTLFLVKKMGVVTITPREWRISSPFLIGGLFAAVALVAMYHDTLVLMETLWSTQEEYSYGYLIPPIVIYFLWQKKDALSSIDFNGSWLGLGVVLLAGAAYILGQLSTLPLIVEYSLVLFLLGLANAAMGWKGFRIVMIPLLLLLFMIPLPQFLFQGLSSKLQLLSSELGVAVIRMFGISVFLEGNVIDLGQYKLQVVEACSGLRYLFPLMSFGFICAYLYNANIWKRGLVFLSTIPITVVMNSFRIGAIGLLVDNWGAAMAEGFLHDFEGWVVFMVCVALLLGEIALLTKLSGGNHHFKEVFGFHVTSHIPGKEQRIGYRPLPWPYRVSTALLVVFAIGAAFIDDRQENIPNRTTFANFPLVIDGWQGSRETMEAVYLDALKLTDYIIVDYKKMNGNAVNFYSAYYASQRSGETAHSPRSCIPGDGWQIRRNTRELLDGVTPGSLFPVNRLQIQRADNRQLVYYWFKQRDRVLTNEYLVKWYLFWDALTRNRTDGALVRLTTQLRPGEDWAQADHRLVGLTRALNKRLAPYIPG